MPKISVIIPVYNISKYLPECLNSILNQTFQDFEVICVNDGSIDNSLEILNSYAQRDERFRIINQKNQGVSISRNIGIENAKGEYIQFVDGDDWLEPNCLELAYNKITETNADVVWFEHLRLDKDKIVFSSFEVNKSKYPFKNKRDIIENFFLCWDKLFKRRFIIDNNIRFAKNLKFSEDLIFCMLLLSKNPNIEYLPDSLYNYRITENSSSHKDNDKLIMAFDVLKYFTSLKEYIDANKDYKLYVINAFCKNAYSWYGYYQDKNSPYKSLKEINQFLKKANMICDKNLLKQSFYYKKICKILRFYYPKLLYCRIFNKSIKPFKY